MLTQLGLPRIAGYRPAWNFQGAIADAIGHFLAVNPDPVPFAVVPKIGFAEPPTLFVEPPPQLPPMSPTAKNAFDRVARKYDPALRDELNRALGLAGEEHIYEAEQRKLFDAGRHDLAKKVRWVSQADGDGLGYDIRSYDESGAEKWIEIKRPEAAIRRRSFCHEMKTKLRKARPEIFRLYRLYDFSEFRGFTLTPPLGRY